MILIYIFEIIVLSRLVAPTHWVKGILTNFSLETNGLLHNRKRK
jgi:hypothetical protein